MCAQKRPLFSRTAKTSRMNENENEILEHWNENENENAKGWPIAEMNK